MSSYANLYRNTNRMTDKFQYLKYKNYIYARGAMEQYRTDCNDGTEIQMPRYTYNPDVNEYPFGKISHPEFLEYERTIEEFVNSHHEFLKTL